MQRKQIELKE